MNIKAIATNDFHGTSVTFMAPVGGGKISKATTKRIFRTLCGMSDCCCGGIRGAQSKMPEGLAIGYTDWDGCLEIVPVETAADLRAKHAAADAYYESLVK
jgi:hypothetical protein